LQGALKCPLFLPALTYKYFVSNVDKEGKLNKETKGGIVKKSNGSIYDTSEKDLLVKHLPLVKRIAGHLNGRLPASIQFDDLVQEGLIGLLEAAKNHDADQGASFETYAGIRIRGAMIDGIRKNNWVPRSVYRNARKIAEAIHILEVRNGRSAQDHEVAKELDISLKKYYELLQKANGYPVLSFNELGKHEVPISYSHNPLEHLQSENLRRILADTIRTLSEREALVLSLYYDEELNLREIGDTLGVSESRACQIHSQAILRMRARMEKKYGSEYLKEEVGRYNTLH